MNNTTWIGAIIRWLMPLLAVTVIWVAVGTPFTLAQSTLSEFGIREADLESRVVSALINGSVAFRSEVRKTFYAASQSARAAFVRSAFPVVKAYTESAAFQTEYAERRAMAKPSAPALEAGGYGQHAYQQALSKHEELYPADPKMMIANRLRAFLELSKDIPYSAELASGVGESMRFADPQLEAKPSQWKRCYRAGKEPVEAARELATTWLKQLEK